MKRSFLLMLSVIMQVHAGEMALEERHKQDCLNENLFSCMYFYAECVDRIVGLVQAGADPSYGQMLFIMATSPRGYDASLNDGERYKRTEKVILSLKDKKDAFRPEYLFGALLKENKEVFELFVKHFLDDKLNVAAVKDEYHHFTVLHYAACYTMREDFLTSLFEKYKSHAVLHDTVNNERKSVIQLLQESGNSFKCRLAQQLQSQGDVK